MDKVKVEHRDVKGACPSPVCPPILAFGTIVSLRISYLFQNLCKVRREVCQCDLGETMMIVAFLDKVKDYSHIRKYPITAYAPAGEASSSP